MATIPASENIFPVVELAEGAAPSTPPTGNVRIYAKSDGLMYSKDDAGAETAMNASAHIADTADAHDASAISIADSGALYTATDVEAALAEVMGAVSGGGIPSTIVDAKGDIIAATAADTVARLAVGTDGQHLVAASGQSTGLQWTDMDHTHDAAGGGATGGGATLAPDSLNVQTIFRLTGNIDSTVNADQNDFNPTNFHTVVLVRFTSFTANRTITGMDAGSTGECKILLNNTGSSLLLTNESASSSANNRFRTPNASTVTVRTSGSALCFYFASRWTVIGA